ncbi:antitoxin Xre/MbcA/ParS toxin-binding domain-containing protein [Ruegeria sp. Ofav3-42]|uniref:type II RES/Xre toxin-antitoxin system antitoxin n=1 Tax=Ruegeria sp. Ofav3-42 TaxID=2917759 RepID=UPI001EF6EA91|nr:antitoxin Xre/MbcA/ParS toxin-binding domain-containing protein [Ruegeria sp. Ofav3-42]MCG7522774.1 DUF2384 domain-containing protein [Ruegeria sp. Ofav3-42]
MAQVSEVENDAVRTYRLLGGKKVFRTPIKNALDAHDVLERGLPSASLLFLVEKIDLLREEGVLGNAVGISVRTLQRRKSDKKTKLLSVDQSNRAWRFAEILGHAIEVMGSREEAEAWMSRPAIGLSYRKPVDLLATAAGSEAVEEYLTRLEYGVYA